MPAVKHKFSQCGHKGFGAYCHVCEDIKKGILVETTDKEGKKRLFCPKKSEREAAKRKVKVEGKEVDVKDIETAITTKKK